MFKKMIATEAKLTIAMSPSAKRISPPTVAANHDGTARTRACFLSLCAPSSSSSSLVNDENGYRGSTA
eukprot:COSAG01_NODE_225_length_21277_cov_71.340023_20_plen_68_part_00